MGGPTMVDRGRGLLVVALVLAGTALAPAPSGAADPPAIVPTATSVGVGGRLSAIATGCAGEAQVDLVVGAAGDERRAGRLVDEDASGTPGTPVPGWVDPAEPAVLAGRCVVDGAVAFTYADVPIDVVPGFVEDATLTVSRTSAAGGQSIAIAVAGCTSPGPAGFALYPSWTLYAGADLSGRTAVAPVGPPEQGRPRSGPVVLNGPDAPLPPGAYTLFVACTNSFRGIASFTRTWAEPVVIEVVGPTSAGTLTGAGTGADRVLVRGEGCDGGRTVVAGRFNQPDATVVPAADGAWTLEVVDAVSPAVADSGGRFTCGDPLADGFTYAIPPITIPHGVRYTQFGGYDAVIPSGTGCTGGRIVHLEGTGTISSLDGAPFAAAVDVVPDADGAWERRFDLDHGYEVTFTATCGDPAGGGFDYAPTTVRGFPDGDDGSARLATASLDPVPSAAPGASVPVEVTGTCTDGVAEPLPFTLQVVGRPAGAALATSEPTDLVDGAATVALPLPDAVGTYDVVAVCGRRTKVLGSVEVAIAPATTTTVAATTTTTSSTIPASTSTTTPGGPGSTPTTGAPPVATTVPTAPPAGAVAGAGAGTGRAPAAAGARAVSGAPTYTG